MAYIRIRSWLAISIIVAITTAGNLGSASAQPVAEQLNNLSDKTVDWSYGYTDRNPILLGGFQDNVLTMPKRLALYFNWLSPVEEYAFSNILKTPIRWQRIGSCCPFQTPNGAMSNTGLLDIYEVRLGQARPVRLFVNHYDEGKIVIPNGFYLHPTLNWQQQWLPALQAYQQSSWEKAIEELKKLVNQPGGMAEYLIGISYFNLNNKQEAQIWFAKAARLGHPEAMADTALSWFKNDPAKHSEAAEMLIQSADLGSSWGRLNAAEYLLNPNNQKVTRENWLKALTFLYQAAEQEEIEAALLAARLLYDEIQNQQGYLKVHDTVEILNFLYIAKLNKPASAAINDLIQQYSRNLSLSNLADFEANAKRWANSYRIPDVVLERYVQAISGEAAAQYEYGLDLWNGLTVPKNIDKSLAFIILSCQQQYNPAVEFLKEFAGIGCSLTPEDLAQVADQKKRQILGLALNLTQSWSP